MCSGCLLLFIPPAFVQTKDNRQMGWSTTFTPHPPGAYGCPLGLFILECAERHFVCEQCYKAVCSLSECCDTPTHNNAKWLRIVFHAVFFLLDVDDVFFTVRVKNNKTYNCNKRYNCKGVVPLLPPPTPPMVYWSGSSRVRIFWPTFGPKFFKSTCLARLFDIYWPSSLSAYWSIFRNRKVRIQMHQLICICSKCMPLTFRQQNLWWLTILTNQILNIQTFIKIIIFYICMCLPSPHFFLKNIFFLL